MKPEALKQELAKQILRPVYLFYGEEGYLCAHYCNMVKELAVREFADFNLSVFQSMDTAELSKTIETPPVLSDRKLIILKNTGFFKSPKAADKEFWEKQLEDIPFYLHIVFLEAEIDKRQKKLLSLVEQIGCAVEFAHLEESQLKAWVNLLISQRGKKIERKTIEHLLSVCPNDMYAIEQEVDKLCSYTPDPVITAAQIDDVISKSAENKIFELSRAILTQKGETAFSILYDLKILREKAIRILSILAKNFCDLYKIKTTAPHLLTPQSTGLHPYVLKKHRADCGGLSENLLKKLIGRTVDADLALKSSPLDEWMILETVVTEMLHFS